MPKVRVGGKEKHFPYNEQGYKDAEKERRRRELERKRKDKKSS